MNRSKPTISLAALDTEHAQSLDPCIWEANRAALAEQQPNLAAALARVTLPPTWRPARALDGSTAWRTDRPGQTPAWLGGTALPHRRAKTLMRQTTVAMTSYVLPAAASGAELPALLAHLPPVLAVFVCEPDPARLAALLRMHDVSAAVRAGRCVLVPPDPPQEFLLDYLRARPGVLPPLRIALPHLADAAHIEHLTRICRHVADTIHAERAQRRAALRIARPPATARTPRLALLALVHEPTPTRHAGQLRHAAQALGWEIELRRIQRPEDMDGLVHAEALAAFAPHLTLCIDHLPSLLPVPLPGPTFAWFTDAASLPASVPPRDAHYLAATPHVLARLRAAGAAEAGLWPFGADPCDAAADDRYRSQSDGEYNGDEERPGDDMRRRAELAADEVVLIGDYPGVAASAVGIEQETHAKLWSAALHVVGAQWQAPRVLHAGRLLRQAEQRCDVSVRDPGLRGRLERLVAEVAVPAIVLENVARAPAAAGLRVHTVGSGWERVAIERVTPLSTSPFDLPAGDAWRPLACIAADPIRLLSPALLGAAVRGWPLLVHRLGRRAPGPVIAGVLEAQHYATFTDTRELLRLLQSIREDPGPTEARAALARRHVCESHSMARRLAELRARVGGACPAPHGR